MGCPPTSKTWNTQNYFCLRKTGKTSGIFKCLSIIFFKVSIFSFHCLSLHYWLHNQKTNVCKYKWLSQQVTQVTQGSHFTLIHNFP